MSDQIPAPDPRDQDAGAEPSPTPPKQDWLRTVARATETVAPLVARQSPKADEIPDDRRGRWATILAIAGILMAVLQFLVQFFDLVTRPLAPLAGALPYVVALLLLAGAGVGVYVVLRARTRRQRLLSLLLTVLVLLVAGSWGGWLAYDALRPPAGYRILIGEFDGSSASQQIDFARRIAEHLRSELTTTGLPIEIRRTPASFADAATARQQGEQQKAGLVIWGWYDDRGVSPHIEVLSLPAPPQPAAGVPILFTTASAANGPGPAAATLQPLLARLGPVTSTPATPPNLDLFVAYGPEQMAFVAAAVLGMSYLANDDLEQARTLFDQALASVAGDPNAQGQEVVHFQRATVNYRLGRYADARADLEAALRIRSDYPAAYMELAVVKANTCTPARDLAGAIADARQAVQIAPDDAGAQRLLAELSLRAGDGQTALASAEAAQRLDPQSSETYRVLAAAYDAAGRPADATAARQGLLRVAQQAATVATPTADAFYALGDAFMGLERYAEAATAYQRALELAPSDPRYQAAQGNVYFWQGKYDDAIRAYGAQAAQSPADPGPHTLMGLAYARQDKPAAALAEYRQAAQLAACDPAPHLLVGGQLAQQGDIAAARDSYAQAVAVDPGNLNARYALATAELYLGNNQAAADQYTTVAASWPDDPDVQYYLGLAYEGLEQTDQAQAAYARAITLFAEQGGEPTHTLAFALEKVGRVDEAIAVLRQLLDQDETADLHAYIGALYERKGAVDLAHEEYARALVLDAGNPLALLGEVNLALRANDLPAAALSLERYLAVTDTPVTDTPVTDTPVTDTPVTDTADSRDLAAQTYTQLGDLDAAYRHLQALARLDPQRAGLAQRLGNTALWLGRLDEADAALNQALRLQPADTGIYFMLAQLAYKRCDPAGAAAHIRQAAAIAPSALLTGTLAGYALAQGEQEQAQPLLAQLQAMPDDDVIAHWMAGVLLTESDPLVARAELTQALTISATAPGITAGVYTALGNLAVIGGDKAAARQAYAAALNAAPDYVDAAIGLGDLALFDDDLAAAKTYYEGALTSLPAYGVKYNFDAIGVLRPLIYARLALAAAPNSKAVEAARAQAQTGVAALQATQPQWPSTLSVAGAVALLAGNQAAADANFAAAVACDRTLADAQARFAALVARVQAANP